MHKYNAKRVSRNDHQTDNKKPRTKMEVEKKSLGTNNDMRQFGLCEFIVHICEHHYNESDKR